MSLCLTLGGGGGRPAAGLRFLEAARSGLVRADCRPSSPDPAILRSGVLKSAGRSWRGNRPITQNRWLRVNSAAGLARPRLQTGTSAICGPSAPHVQAQIEIADPDDGGDQKMPTPTIRTSVSPGAVMNLADHVVRQDEGLHSCNSPFRKSKPKKTRNAPTKAWTGARPGTSIFHNAGTWQAWVVISGAALRF